MKLYELHRHDKFMIDDGSGFDEVFTLDHIDGAYSVCLNKNNDIVHIAAWTPVKQVEGEQNA